MNPSAAWLFVSDGQQFEACLLGRKLQDTDKARHVLENLNVSTDVLVFTFLFLSVLFSIPG